MNPETLEAARRFFFWSTILNYVVLLAWVTVFVFAHDAIQRLHTRWFRLSPNQFDAIHYALMGLFKLGILLLNLVPLVVSWIIG